LSITTVIFSDITAL